MSLCNAKRCLATGTTALDFGWAAHDNNALLVSSCSLGLAVHSAHTMERLVEANSRPFLRFTKRFSISVDGEPAKDFVDAIRVLKNSALAKHLLMDTTVETGSPRPESIKKC